MLDAGIAFCQFQAMADARQKNARIFARAEDDWYVEPRAASEALFKRERFGDGIVWDCCCGGGNICKSAFERGLRVTGTDKVDRFGANAKPFWFKGVRDFFSIKEPLGRHLVFNPPYKGGLAEKFIRYALTLAEGKVAAFVEARFLFGNERARGLFLDLPPTRIYAMTPRVSAPPGQYILDGGKVGGGQPDHVWLVYERGVAGTQFLWLGQ